MREVTKDEFYATVGKMNVHPSPERDQTNWKCCRTGRLLGRSTQGYVPRRGEEERFFIVENLQAS